MEILYSADPYITSSRGLLSLIASRFTYLLQPLEWILVSHSAINLPNVGNLITYNLFVPIILLYLSIHCISEPS